VLALTRSPDLRFDCDWGTVLHWDPPHRLVLASQIDGHWQYEPDVAKSSEVDVRFTPESDGSTRGLLQLFAAQVAQTT
jgi:hypothetical protein